MCFCFFLRQHFNSDITDMVAEAAAEYRQTVTNCRFIDETLGMVYIYKKGDNYYLVDTSTYAYINITRPRETNTFVSPCTLELHKLLTRQKECPQKSFFECWEYHSEHIRELAQEVVRTR